MSLREIVFPEPWMRWYDLPGLRRLALARFSFFRKGWHPTVRRLARLRALYWVIVRGHDSEICARCGHPVGLVYIAPDAIWTAASGYADPSPGGQSSPGILCPHCLGDLAKAAGLPFLRWTCTTDDSPYEAWVASHPARTMPAKAEAAASTTASSTPKPRPHMRGKRACDE